MEQLRLGLPRRDPANPLSRLVFGLFTIVLGLAVAALVLFVALPIAGIIVSAAVGGVLLTLAGIVMMIPFLLVAGTVLVLMNRSGQRKASPVRARTYSH
jgi:hypothetical protein